MGIITSALSFCRVRYARKTVDFTK